MSILKHSYQNEEETLIKAAANGNLETFNQLVLKYQDMAYNHALALLNDPVLAQDATQESFIKAFQSIGGFRGGSWRGWLLKIVTNSAYDILRRFHRHPIQPLFPENANGEETESATWLSDPTASVQETVEQKEFSEDLYRIINELPEAFRSVLTLVDIFELDYAETAQSLNIPMGTVKSRVARARLQVQEKLRGRLSHTVSMTHHRISADRILGEAALDAEVTASEVGK